MNIQKPNRKKHTFEQHLSAPPQTVFPLLCPVGEEKWVPGWETELVLSNSGVVEHDCMFITPADDQSSIWIVAKYHPSAFHLQMYKVTPGHTIGKLEISLQNQGSDACKATISYEFTALAKAGEDFLKEFTQQWYVDFMQGWEKALNHYLTTGEKLS